MSETTITRVIKKEMSEPVNGKQQTCEWMKWTPSADAKAAILDAIQSDVESHAASWISNGCFIIRASVCVDMLVNCSEERRSEDNMTVKRVLDRIKDRAVAAADYELAAKALQLSEDAMRLAESPPPSTHEWRFVGKEPEGGQP